jgi:hypothetical protein
MHTNLEDSKSSSKRKMEELQKEILISFNEEDFSKSFLTNVCVYACGSLARHELVANSDLDLFFIYDGESPISNIDKYRFFSKLYDINKKCGFKEPSKGGGFWDFITKENLLDIGSRNEDYNNSFTARLLLILESKPILNKTLYNKIIEDTTSLYFKDYEEHKEDFAPMYLINDILRYWYTLTLNYEFRRDKKDNNQDKHWKRLKLKYPRLLTCYSTIACLFKNNISHTDVIEIINKTPIERLQYVKSMNSEASKIIDDIEKEYDWMLSLKTSDSSWWDEKSNKQKAYEKAHAFHDLIIHQLIDEMSKYNSELKKKLDF